MCLLRYHCCLQYNYIYIYLYSIVFYILTYIYIYIKYVVQQHLLQFTRNIHIQQCSPNGTSLGVQLDNVFFCPKVRNFGSCVGRLRNSVPPIERYLINCKKQQLSFLQYSRSFVLHLDTFIQALQFLFEFYL